MGLLILDWIRENIFCAWLTPLMRLFSLMGDGGLIWLLICGLLLIRKDSRRYAVAAVIALLLSVLVCNLTLKPLAARPRPFLWREDVFLPFAAPTDYSFPSGHASASFAAATALSGWRRWSKILFLSLAVLIAFSRLYFYVHYPGDVLAGGLLGAALSWPAMRITRHLEQKWPCFFGLS